MTAARDSARRKDYHIRKMRADQNPRPLVDLPPRSAAIVAIVIPGSPATVQIDLFNVLGEGQKPLCRYTTPIDNAIEAAAAFEMLLAGTVWGTRKEMGTLVLPNQKVTDA